MLPLRSFEDFSLVYDNTALGADQQFRERVLNPQQSRMGSGAVENHIEPTAIGRI